MHGFRGLLAVSLAGAALGCGQSGGSGGSSHQGVPSEPLSGTIDGLPFSVGSAYAKPIPQNDSTFIILSSYYEDCSQGIFPPDNSTGVTIAVPNSLLSVGTYALAGDIFDDAAVQVTAWANPVENGQLVNWSDYLSDGTVWLTAVSPTEIGGAVTAGHARTNVNFSGAFTSPRCEVDGGI